MEDWCKKNLIVANPEYGKKVRMHLWLGNTPKWLQLYERDGETIVEDVKGQDKKTGKLQMTEAFRLKWKLLQAKYPQYKFELY